MNTLLNFCTSGDALPTRLICLHYITIHATFFSKLSSSILKSFMVGLVSSPHALSIHNGFNKLPVKPAIRTLIIYISQII